MEPVTSFEQARQVAAKYAAKDRFPNPWGYESPLCYHINFNDGKRATFGSHGIFIPKDGSKPVNHRHGAPGDRRQWPDPDYEARWVKYSRDIYENGVEVGDLESPTYTDW